MTRCGVFMFATDYAMTPAALARAVEARGLDSLFFPDHSHVPIRSAAAWPGDGELPRHFSHTLDPLVALAACAAVTDRIRLGTAVCLVSQRDPIILAKALASLDVISRGRVIAGVAGGWNRAEMEEHGTPFKKRWPVVRERVLAMKTIWSCEQPEFHGDHVDFDAFWSWPKPQQAGGPPVWIGSHSRAVPARVAEYADGWMPVNGRYAGNPIVDLKAACANRGRAFEDLTMALFDAPADATRARRLADQGYAELIFSLPSEDGDAVLRKLDHLSELAIRIRSA